MANPSKSTVLDDAIEAFNRGDYFDAAEMFETAVRDGEADVKEIADALNRIAAALHLRFERGGRQATINLLSQAMISLEAMRPDRGGIDIERLYAEIAAYTDEVRESPRDEQGGIKHRARIFVERRRAPKIARSR